MNRFYPAVAERAGHRCEYCLVREELFNGGLEVEHIHPRSRGGANRLDNLALSCEPCNTYKATAIDAIDPVTGSRARLYNPRVDLWAEHFQVVGEIVVEGITPEGRGTVVQLGLNAARQIRARAIWRSVDRWP